MEQLVHVVNRKTAKNLGDQAIAEAMESFLRDHGYEVKSWEFLGQGSRNIFRIYTSILGLRREMRRGVIIIGGGQLLRANKTFPHALIAWILLAKINRMKLVAYSVGADDEGRFMQKLWSNLALRLLRTSVEKLSVRDKLSVERLTKLGFQDVHQVPDAIFLSLGKKHRRNTEFMTIFVASPKLHREYKTQSSSYFESLAATIRLKPREITLRIAYSSIAEEPHAIDFCKYAGLPASCLVAPRSADSLWELIGRSTLVVSSRMHPILIAKCLGVEYLSLPFNIKTANMAETLRQMDVKSMHVEAAAGLENLIKSALTPDMANRHERP